MREEKIISALIGLVGACNNNPKTADTDRLLIKALAFPLICPKFDDMALEKLVSEIYTEKYTIAPGCATCTSPCGNTSDYDMSRIYSAEEPIQNIKLQILSKLQTIAFRLYNRKTPESISASDTDFLYKALAYISYDLEKQPLMELFTEAERTEQTLCTGGI